MSSPQGAVKTLAGVPLVPLLHGAASKQVLGQLRMLIIDGRLAPGDRLPPEPEVASAFGVSRSVVREATKVLAAQGFLTVRQGSGTVVNRSRDWNIFDPDVLLATQRDTTYANLMEARRLLEPYLAARAAELATEVATARIAEVLEHERPPDDEHVRTDIEFHRRIAEAAANPVLVIALDSITAFLREHRRELCTVPGSVDRAIRWHQEIFAAVEARNPARARAAMDGHLDQVAEDYGKLPDRRAS